MSVSRSDNLVRLQRHPAQGESSGVAAGMRSALRGGRYEVVSAGPNPEFGFTGSDPWDTNVGTGLVVPATPSSAIGGARYLLLLARARFQTGEQGSEMLGARLVGIRQYAELVARIPAGESPLASTGESGPAAGSTVVFRKEIASPLWHPPDGSISWHVTITNLVQRDSRHPANADGFVYQDAMSPAILFQTPAPYSPPNGGRPWGRSIAASLGNIHELRYRSRSDQSERVLDVPVPVPCDVSLYASVRQNDPSTNPSLADATTTQQFVALSEEDRFLVAYSAFAQYGIVAGALTFEDNLGRCVP